MPLQYGHNTNHNSVRMIMYPTPISHRFYLLNTLLKLFFFFYLYIDTTVMQIYINNKYCTQERLFTGMYSDYLPPWLGYLYRR